MKFVIEEIKLWFNKPVPPRILPLLPNKVNVITGDSSTGKSSILKVINYCLLSEKAEIVQEIINENVEWYSMLFRINDRKYAIGRKNPIADTISNEIYFEERQDFPNKLYANIDINEVRAMFDKEFGITDALRFPLGKEIGPSDFLLSFRHFLLFNFLTEDIIGTSKTYFDTVFFGKKEYDEALQHIFNMVIGVDDMKVSKAQERLKEIELEIARINKDHQNCLNAEKRFENGIKELIKKSKDNSLVEFNDSFDNIELAIEELKKIISQYREMANNEFINNEFIELTRQKRSLKYQIRNIENFKKEYTEYRKNLSNYEDSLLPIEYIKDNFSEVFQCYETAILLNSLQDSLKEIRSAYSPNKLEPFEVSDKLKELNKELENVNLKVEEITKLKKPFDTEARKFIIIGEIKAELNNLIQRRKPVIPLDNLKLNVLDQEKRNLSQISTDTSEDRRAMLNRLNDCIQRNYDKINSMPTYKNFRTDFYTDTMELKLRVPGELFPSESIGSKSNFMFLHLCFFLGLHEQMIKVGQVHVPRFIFIDQPSIPYYSDRDKVSSDDRKKLLDAFSLINSFMEYLTEELKTDFQILMVEHAPKEYWINNKLEYFHTVEEFIDGNGLIPQYVLNYKEDEY